MVSSTYRIDPYVSRKRRERENRGNSVVALIHTKSEFSEMATLYNVPERVQPKHYRSYFSTLNDQLEAIKGSRTVYVGNINFTTPEERIYDFFSRCGPVKQVIMGVNRFTLKPCGFCFVM